MSEIKRIRQRQQLRWGAVLILFVLINLVLRAPLLFLNKAEYTDGILQLIQFRENTGIYPPLYTAIVWPFSFLFDQLWAGRFISYLFSVAAVIPLYLMARRSFGMRAAVFTAIVYTVAPESLRWSTRVMTESMFSFFFWFALERLLCAQGARDRDSANFSLVLASVLGTLAALTRYQGMMLLPFILGLAVFLGHVRGVWAIKGILSTLLFALVPLWSLYAGNIHGSQFAERTRDLGPLMTFVNFAEPFVLLMPYFLTYPVAVFVFVGFNVGRARNTYMMTPMTLYVFVVLLVFQSLFASFQERYFYPFFGILFIWAGLGLAVVDDRCRRRAPRWRFYAPTIVVVWSLFISALVLLGSREAFGDIADAARRAGSVSRAEGGTPVYTNELYRLERDGQPRIAGTKVSFFAGLEAEFLTPEHYMGIKRIPDGALIVFSARDDYAQMRGALEGRYQLEVVETFGAVLTPVFPDLMQNRGMEQSPAAWLFRYQPQHFETTVYRVQGMRRTP